MVNEPLQLTRSEQLQRGHYQAIGDDYETHYSDTFSQQYRIQFMYEPMLEGINIAGRRVLDAMCGSGQAAGFLLSRGAQVVGLDISTKALEAFKEQWPDTETVCRSARDSGLESESFDCVVVIGGLHHAHPSLSEVLREFHRLLKPGGHLCFVEPHRGSLFDSLRQLWYRHDNLFSENEESIDLDDLHAEFANEFRFTREVYRGNVAYLAVLNSMVLRIPLSLKAVYSPAMLRLESTLNKLQGKRSSCCVIAQWQKI